MASFPKILVPRKYIRQNWDEDAYRYLSEFFTKAYFDAGVQVIPGASIDDYRGGSADDGWALPCGTAAAEYASYFRVIDASSSGACKIGVTAGGAVLAGSGICGTVKINGTRVDVDEFTSDPIVAAGEVYVWRHSWYDAIAGAKCEIILGDSAAPDNPNGGLAYASRLLGVVVVAVDDGVYSITDKTQHFLCGGDDIEILYRACVIKVPE